MKVSVIIPTFNRSRIIGRSLDSVLNQSIAPYEIIVVDDGSTDNTREIIERYRYKIQYFYQDNSGKPGIARNRGLEEARGDWIAFLDSDDVWHPDKMKLQLQLIEKTSSPLGLVFSDYELVKNDTSFQRAKVFNGSDLELLTEFAFKEGNVFKKELFNYFLIWKNPIHTSSVLLNKKLLSSVFGFDPSLTIAEDLDLWIRCSEQMQVGYVPEATCKYIHEGDNITEDKILYNKSVFNVRYKYYNRTKQKMPNWLRAEIKSSFRRHFRANSFLNAKLGKRWAAINDIIKSMHYPDTSLIRYLCQISIALISPSIYNFIKKRICA
jgi:glycosyltransferase involved in cell wall biosynthesis